MGKRYPLTSPELVNWAHENFRSFRLLLEDRSFGPLLRDRYNVEKILGAGSEGAVLLLSPLDGSTATPVAFKMLQDGLAQQYAPRARMRQEAAMLRRCAGPHVVRLEGVAGIAGTDETALLLEPLVEPTSRKSISLANIAQVEHRPSIKDIARWFKMCLCGVESLHANGVAHRDIKLENFCFSPNLEVKLVDLALALPVADMRSGPRTLCGTPSYWPPEILRTQNPLGIDLYGLCLLLAEMLLGKKMGYPANERNFEKLMELAEASRVRVHQDLDNSTLPPKLVEFVKRGTGPSAGSHHRYASIEQMKMAFNHVTLSL